MGKLELGDSVVRHEGKFIQMIERPFTNKETGEKGHWEFVQRKTHGRIVAVMALTSDEQLVLTKTFRVPINRYIVECCAGLADQKGESEVGLARRELSEETGYVCDRMRLIMSGHFNAGLCTDEIAFYLGSDARRVAKPQLEAAEDIEVILVPMSGLVPFLSSPPDGVAVDVKLWGVLPFIT